MTTINVYLTFNGECKEAFDFYQSVFGGEFSSINRFREMPPQEGIPPLPESDLDKIMHITLPISKETSLMGSDTGGEWAANYSQGNNFSISVNTDTPEDAENIFNALSVKGEIIMPFQVTFWNSHFGQLKDQFGINWMVSCEIKQD